MQLRDFGLLILLGAIWGASYLFIRVAAPVLGPLAVADLRVLIASSTLLLYAAWIRQLPNFRSHWRQLFLLGAVNAALPFTLIGQSTVLLNASMAAILNSTTPLFTALVAALWIKERLTARKIVGMTLGFTGVVILIGWSPLGLNRTVLLGVLGSLAGALCYSIGGVYAKVGFQGLGTLEMAIGQQLAAGILLLPIAAATAQRTPLTWPVLGAMLALGLLCTAFAYLIFFTLIARVGPTNTLSVTFLVPVFGTLWGVLFLHEPLRLSLVLGLIVILAGVTLVTGVRLPFGRVASPELSSAQAKSMTDR